ncbi:MULTISPECIES: hypothetical protein [unclassified Nocardioides]|uniref:hypothetical protein n=1 Tax=unclassified Nocardioides TaxID=2615069 RepID=UPI000703820D|nr:MULTISPECIES: hypothetical protein [unclassified Nocardioides]KQZ70559.1 hypothetical protein ASD66_13255 [Nocardioides sp. Root151]KRF16942.1 hypothetical protein ASH02_02495 [Nocardioides sp. Soil796]
MRSESRCDEQAFLPFDPPPTAPASASTTSAKGRDDGAIRHLMVDDALASLGWPAGTELLLSPCRTPRRGQVVLASDGSSLRIGIFDLHLGRAALRTDHGTVWIGRASQVIGAVTEAAAPLTGMPGS